MKKKDVLEYDYIGIDTIEDLLVEFDEMGFAPTATMPNAEEYAKEWKKKMLACIKHLQKEANITLATKRKIAMFRYEQSKFEIAAQKKREARKDAAREVIWWFKNRSSCFPSDEEIANFARKFGIKKEDVGCRRKK